MAEDMEKGMPFVTKALVIAIMAVIVVILSAGIAWFVASKATVGAVKGESEKEEEIVTQEKKVKVEVGEIIPLGEYTINLKAEDGRYLMCEINLEIEKTKDSVKNKVEIDEKKIIIQDKILSILRNKSKADLDSDKDFIMLKKEMMANINGILQKVKVKNVYFIKWIIQ
jgi:flagellar basal body-associated protein FliL